MLNKNESLKDADRQIQNLETQVQSFKQKDAFNS